MNKDGLNSLAHMIDYSADQYPDKAAFRFNGQEVSYANLIKRSNALAHVLVDHGVKRGDRVGIYLSSSLESAVAIYGIWRAGAAYVPIDPQTPVSRLCFMIKDCEIKVLISENALQAQIKKLAEHTTLQCVIGLENSGDFPVQSMSWAEVGSAPDEMTPAIRVTEQDLAYIMYTSGSTGNPKGLMHTHFSGLSYARLSVETYDVKPDDRIGNSAPLHFDISTFGFFSSVLASATTVIVPDIVTKFPANLSQLMADERLTIWYSVPFILVQLLHNGVLSERDFSALRWVLFGGEPFQPQRLRKLMQMLPKARFSNVYGPAEVNQCTYYHLPDLPMENDECVPLGQIWGKTQGLVLNDEDQLDTVGELLIRSPTMMKGYWKRSDLDEKAFYYPSSTPEKNTQAKESLQNEHCERYYRTGDIVKIQGNGQYQFVGRKDHQVKVRGFRVELGEIELALQAYQEVIEACAFLEAGPENSQHIEAAVSLESQSNITADLFEHLKTKLSWYAIPSKLHVVARFPRTSSGKINRILLQREVHKLTC